MPLQNMRRKSFLLRLKSIGGDKKRKSDSKQILQRLGTLNHVQIRRGGVAGAPRQEKMLQSENQLNSPLRVGYRRSSKLTVHQQESCPVQNASQKDSSVDSFVEESCDDYDDSGFESISLNSEDTVVKDCEPIFGQAYEASYIDNIRQKLQFDIIERKKLKRKGVDYD